ncbi:MAG: hypothetical protein KAJ29_06845, partial [Alphaproteobacteria bacterium]|nr:hypothetical protein [Alphaproteobacteria bacterium]
EEDESKAAQLFEKGASLGHGMCTVTHGLNLYYGLFGLKVSKNKGLKYIKKAVDMKVPGAKEELEKIENEQKEHK